MICVVVNGDPVEVADSVSIAELIAVLDLRKRVAAVEHNGDAVPPSEFASRRLAEGDRLELVRTVAGG